MEKGEILANGDPLEIGLALAPYLGKEKESHQKYRGIPSAPTNIQFKKIDGPITF